MNDLIEKTENVINKLCKAVEIEDEKYIRMDDKYSNLIPIIIGELKKYMVILYRSFSEHWFLKFDVNP